jgi:hypothetical protein
MFALSGGKAGGQTNDRGIGGTGLPGIAEEQDRDRGIGGTGVIGTIRKFGSIFVNGLRIAYPKNVKVRIDGQNAHASQLRIGQVVHVVAGRHNGVYATKSIDVFSEVVGSVEAVSNDRLVVLGQNIWVSTATRSSSWNVGDHVAVSGLRRPDGVIVASLIERRAGTMERVAGPVIQASDGSLRIGTLRLMGVDAALVGQRASLSGQSVDGAFSVSQSHDEFADLRENARTLLVESYVENVEGNLRVGSGFSIVSRDMAVPVGKTVRAVLSGRIGSGGVLQVNSFQIESQTGGEGNNGFARPAEGNDLPVPHDVGGQHPGGSFGGRQGDDFGHMHTNGPNGGGFGGPSPNMNGPPGFNSGSGPGGFGPGSGGGGGPR